MLKNAVVPRRRGGRNVENQNIERSERRKFFLKMIRMSKDQNIENQNVENQNIENQNV